MIFDPMLPHAAACAARGTVARPQQLIPNTGPRRNRPRTGRHCCTSPPGHLGEAMNDIDRVEAQHDDEHIVPLNHSETVTRSSRSWHR